MIEAVMNYNFMQNAVMSAFFASIICGIIGTIVIEKNLVMMSGGIAHTSFGGIGLGYYLEFEPLLGGLVFAVFSAISIVKIKNKTTTKSDTLIGLFWSVGMALGILFISFTPGYPPTMSTYLFGDILTTSQLDVIFAGLLAFFIVFMIGSYYNYWKAYLFDDEFLAVLGINTGFIEYFLFILIAFAIVVLIKLVGIILVIALLTAPAAIARIFTYSLKKMMITAVILSMFFAGMGLYLSYNFDVPSGATIILLAGGSYILIAIFKNIIRNNFMG